MGRTSLRKPTGDWPIPVALAAVLTVFVVCPLVNMFAGMDLHSIRQVLGGDALPAVLGRSVVSSLLTTVISLILAYTLAWCLERTAIPGKGLLRILAVLPMLIPSVSIGMGVVLLCGNNGILSEFLNLPVGWIYGLPGIVFGSVLYSFPVAFLLIENILKYEDSTPYEAADILGLSRWQQFTAITVPYLRKPMIVVAFSTFVLSFTDYGVPLMVGGKYVTLPMLMYQEVIGQLNFGRGCVYGSILLIPAVAAFVLDFTSQKNNNSVSVVKPFTPEPRAARDIPAMLYSIAAAIFSMLPILAFLVLAVVRRYPTDMSLTFRNILKTMQMGGDRYLLNSVAIALSVSVAGVFLAVLAAYYTARTRSAVSGYLHLICMSVAAVPGIVLGLAYVLLFRGSPLYGTLAILVCVNVVHFFASPYVMMYTAFSKANDNLEAVASTLGIGRLRLLTGILLPGCRKTLAEMFASFFVNSMMTISAVSFLARSRTKPIALMINQFEAQAQMEYAAVVSLVILLINLLVKVLMEWQPGRRKARG